MNFWWGSMVKRKFNDWISNFRESIANFKYYIDFETVYKNAERYKIELNILNSLVGSINIESDFENIIKKYPDALKAIPILIAKRETQIFCMDSSGAYNFDFTKKNYSISDYVGFMRKTGLFDLFENHLINNVYDYVIGVEVGLNSNGRKNRGGHLMENLVEDFILKAGFIKDETYFKEMNLSDLEQKTGLDLSPLSNFGKTEKRFDFVIISLECVHAIECNFYSSAGSKLNETARSYKTLALESKNIEGFKFIWITDGFGWNSAKKNLEETFDVLDDLYCIKDLESGILNTL